MRSKRIVPRIRKKRGPFYKIWLQNKKKPIPESTERYRRKCIKQLENLNNSTLEVNDAINEPSNHDQSNTDNTILMPYDAKDESESETHDQDLQYLSDDSDDISDSSLENSEYSSEEEPEATEYTCGYNVILDNEDIDVIHDDGDMNFVHDDGDMNVIHDDGNTEVNEMDDDSIDSNIEEKLYDGCPISKKESELVTMAFALRHNLPDVGLENVLSLIDCHLPFAAHKSKYLFLKAFPKYPYQIHYLCIKCDTGVDFNEMDTSTCENCEEKNFKKKLREVGKFFIHVPLKNQIVDITNSDLYKSIKRETQTNDIINGKVYQHMKSKGIIGKNDLTIQWNVDGVSLQKSSKKSLWPILVAINEFPYRVRKNNILICGLWYGQEKPIMNTFLKPFVDELITLSDNGFTSSTFIDTTPVLMKVHEIIAPVDSIARPLVQNMKQFNGKYGCPYCLNKGSLVETDKGRTRIYSFDKCTSRNAKQHLAHVKQTLEDNKPVKGVKGPSIVSLLRNSNIIKSYPPEHMHSCLLGVAKLFVTSWFDSKYSSEKFSIRARDSEFTERLLKIQPPIEITRVPRPIDTNYKANEWKTFVLYYSIPCITNLMPQSYVKHWSLFVYGLSILLQEKIITPDELNSSRLAFFNFVKKIPKLYGMTFMKFNVHLLTHIPDFVELYGSLWAWSAFPFEGFNGVIKKLFHGTQYIPDQIIKSYGRLRIIKNASHIFSDPNCSEKNSNLFIKLMNQCNAHNCIEYGSSLNCFGRINRCKLSLIMKVEISNTLQKEVGDFCEEYQRFIFNVTVFHTSTNNRLKKRNNSIIMTIDEEILEITHLLDVGASKEGTDNIVVLAVRFKKHEDVLCNNSGFSSQQYSFICSRTQSIICIKIEKIFKKCISVPLPDGKCCIFPLTNRIETD
ncbi:hypothetical protein TKK_0006897 [Trichogramma kaykai]|uniref:Transposase domain-containing protein n=1 Tax=Trichogramma kaykai TaxID=54128 RepID=A0ABD2X9W8_9HYME